MITRRTVYLLLLASSLLAPLASVHAEPVHPNQQLADHALNDRVEALLKRMTLEEKVGQLVQYSGGFATGPAQSKATYEQLIEQGKVGSLENVTTTEATNRYQHIAVEKSRLHIPLLFGLDVIHGDHTTFPVPIAMAASFDPALVEQLAHTSAVEARADGINWVFSPMVDVARDARWGRMVESTSGEDPYLGEQNARAWVRGYQQGDLSKPDSVAVSVKHFAAYGAPIAGRDYNAVDMSDITLRQEYLPPYQAAVEAGAATMMSSFNTLNGVPVTANPYVLTKILRHEWGFDGMVVSDWGAVAELLHHGVARTGAEAARKALEAGVDMDMESDLYGPTLVDQVRAGKVPESVVDEAVRRVLRVKFALGLFEHPYTPVTPAYAPTESLRAEARHAAAESLVLLKNDAVEGVGAVLPLKAGKTVALIGPFADSAKDMIGSWGAQGDPKYAVTLRTALSERLGAKLSYAKGANVLIGEDERRMESASFLGTATKVNTITDDAVTIPEAVEAAKKADVAVVALGEAADWMTGEATSRAHLELPGNQEKLLEAVVATGKPVVLVVFSGRPMVLKWASEHVPAIVEAWFPGIEAGHAVADVLYGDVNPSGKTPVSFPRAVGQEPLYYAVTNTGRPAGDADLTHIPAGSEDKFLSRYIDEQNSALYPFGWGLSYTRFRYSTPTISRTTLPLNEARVGAKDLVTVGVDVTNAGSVAGDEVVQLYVRNVGASVEQSVRELKGFERVHLKAGETRHIDFSLGFDALSFVNTDSKRTVEATDYTVFVGGSSLADKSAAFSIE